MGRTIERAVIIVPYPVPLPIPDEVYRVAEWHRGLIISGLPWLLKWWSAPGAELAYYTNVMVNDQEWEAGDPVEVPGEDEGARLYHALPPTATEEM